jgi:hypothetical protein
MSETFKWFRELWTMTDKDHYLSPNHQAAVELFVEGRISHTYPHSLNTISVIFLNLAEMDSMKSTIAHIVSTVMQPQVSPPPPPSPYPSLLLCKYTRSDILFVSMYLFYY